MQRFQLPRTLSSPAQKTNSASGSRYKSRLTLSPWDTSYYQPFVIHEISIPCSQPKDELPGSSFQRELRQISFLSPCQDTKLTLDRSLVRQIVLEQILTLSALE